MNIEVLKCKAEKFKTAKCKSKKPDVRSQEPVVENIEY